MKVHTSDFKEQIKQFGRELDSKITYEIDNEEIELGKEELNSVSPHYEGAILKSVMKQLDIDSNVEIPVGTILNYQFGVKIDEEYEYIDFGNYIVYSIEKQEDTNSYKITCYDKLLYSMKDYENSDITFPITIKEYLEAICEKIGLTYEGSAFANSEKIISNELFLDSEGRSMNYTFRDVLDQIAEASGGTICINKDDELEVRYIHDVGEIIDVSNSSIAITNSEEAELQVFELEGKTTQATRSGKNLFNFSGKTSHDITSTYDNGIVLNGTTSSTWFDISNNSSVNSSDTTYTISVNKPLPFRLSYVYTNGNNTTVYKFINKGSTSLTFTDSYGIYSGHLTADQLDTTSFSNYTFTFQLEVGSTATSYEPYGVMPSPDYPSELNSVGYENLLIPLTQATTNALRSDMTNFKAGTYTIYFDTSLTPTWQLSAYKVVNGTRTAIAYKYNANELTFTVEEEITLQIEVYKTGILLSDVENAMLVKGTQKHSYIPYGKYGIEVKTTGKNLVPFVNQDFIVNNVRYYVEDGSLYINGTSTGETSSNNANFKNNFNFTLSAGTYTIQQGNSQLGLYLRKYDDNSLIFSNPNYVAVNSSRQFTLTEETRLYFGFYVYQNTFNNVATKIMVEKSSTATEYEPYKENTQLYTLDEPLRSIGDTKDLLYIKNGMLYVDRKIGSVVLDGSEEYLQYSTTTKFFTILNDALFDNNINILCDKYLGKVSGTGSSTYDNYTCWLQNTPTYKRLYFRNDNCSNANEFKTAIQAEQPKIYYPLAEPYTEELGYVQMPSTYDGITYIETTDVLEPTMNISYISEFEEIDEEYLKDVNVNFGEKFGAVNTIVLSRGGEGDKIALSIPENLADEDKIAIQITDNQIMNGNDRDTYMADILNQLYGLEYYINDFTSTGICYLDLCDRYRIKIGDTSYKCVMFNDEVNITQGLTENIYTDMPKESQQEYKYMNSTDRGITQANIIAKKSEATITAYTQRLDDVTGRLNAVETKQTATDVTIGILGTNIDDNGNITAVKVKEGYTFDENGFQIYTDDSSFKTLIDETGTYYYDGNSVTGQYTKDGSKQKDLQLFGVYYYGMDDIDDDAMFVAQLYTDENGDEGFGHFYNRGD